MTQINLSPAQVEAERKAVTVDPALGKVAAAVPTLQIALASADRSRLC